MHPISDRGSPGGVEPGGIHLLRRVHGAARRGAADSAGGNPFAPWMVMVRSTPPTRACGIGGVFDHVKPKAPIDAFPAGVEVSERRCSRRPTHERQPATQGMEEEPR